MAQTAEIIDYLSRFVTANRNAAIDRVLDSRTRYITVAIEDVYQPHNASAVLRTCECFGIHDVHIIENKNEYRINPDVVMGATKWLDIHRYNRKEYNTPDCIKTLREQGYRIIATNLDKKSKSLQEFGIRKGKAALFFGTELTGLSPEMLELADEHLIIPISGFTESFNISVSAAIIIHHLILQLRESEIDWKLSPHEKEALKLQWLKQSIKKSGQLIRDFESRPKKMN